MPFWKKKKWRKKKLGLLIAIPIVSLAFLIVGIVRFFFIVGIVRFEIVHPKSKHVAIVSSHSHGQEVYVGTESMGKTPTRLKLKGDAKISIQASSKHEAIEAIEVKEILKNDVIFTNLPIEEKFESHQYREIVEDMKGNLERNGHLIIPEKRYLAYSYFWLGKLLEAKAKLDELIEKHLESLSRSDQAEVFMYLGYCNLNLGNESEARKNFIDAFKRNLYLEHNHDALRNKELGERVVREAKIAAQMEVRLDLFVAVDISQSALKGQEARIVELQNGVVTKLNEIGQAFFYPFGKTLPASEFSNYSSSPDAIIQVQDLSPFAQWTDFLELFDKLPQIIENHRQNQDSSGHQIAILIISDGEHSTEDDEGGDTIRIPLEVARKFEAFSENHKDVPIVMVTIDQETQENTEASSSDADIGTRGLNYADKWRKELKKHPVGQSFYYGSKSTLDNILENIFNVIAPYRDKVLVTHAPERETESNSADNQEWYIVPVRIQTTLSEVTLKVGTSIAGKKDDDAPKINTIWEELKGKNREKSSLTISRQPPNDRIDRSERVLINRANLREAFKREAVKKANSNSSLWTPQIFTLNFYQGEGEVGTVSLPFSEDKPPFSEDKPKIQIEPMFGEDVILKARQKRDLRFKANIIDPSHHFKQAIPIKVIVEKDQVFRGKIVEFTPTIKTEIIPKDTTDKRGRHEFNLSIEAFGIDRPWGKNICDGKIKISVKPYENNPVYTIDDSKLGKINFRVVHKWVYFAHQCAQFIWVPFLAIVLLIFHPSTKIRKTTSRKSSDPDEKPGFLSKVFELLEGWLEKCKRRKWPFYLFSLIAFLLVNLSIWIYWPSPILWILILISLILLGIRWKTLKPLLILFSVVSLVCAAVGLWVSAPWANWTLMLTLIPTIPCIVLIYHQFVPGNPFDHSNILNSGLCIAELWVALQNIIVFGKDMLGLSQFILAIFRYFRQSNPFI